VFAPYGTSLNGDHWSASSPLLLERFNRRKRAVTGNWHVDETYI
jgi:hypothetical protein